MATINEIATGASYTGRAELGGGNAGVITMETKPLENLAYYTMLYNKTVHEQKQKEKDAQVKELADLSNIRLNDLRGKDKEQVTIEFAELVKAAGEHAKYIPVSQQDRMRHELEWQTKYGAFKNNYGSGKTRAVAYETQLNDINSKITDPKAKEIALNKLNEKFDGTDISTPLSTMDNYKLETIEIPKPVVTEVQALAIGDNEVFNTTGKIYNPRVNAPLADQVVFGVKKAYPVKGSPEYDALSPNEKTQADYQATVDSDAKLAVEMTDVLNSVLLAKDENKKLLYVNDDGTFNHEKFKNDNYSNSTIMAAYESLYNFDTKNRTNYKQALDPNGVFTDKGVEFKLRTPVDPNDFKFGFVDFQKGITPNQLVQAGMFAKHTGDSFETKMVETDNQIQKDAQALQLRIKQLDEAGLNFRALLPYKELKKAEKATAEEKEKLVSEFGNLIYNVNVPKPIDLKQPDGKVIPGVKIKQGTMVDSEDKEVKFNGYLQLPTGYFDNSIVTEYDKYVGSVRKDKEGNVLSTNMPTKLSRDEKGNFIIRMKDGEIDGIKTDDGSFVSVDQFRHITLTAGQKGATKYRKPDVQYGTTGRGSGSGTTTQKVDANGFPIE